MKKIQRVSESQARTYRKKLNIDVEKILKKEESISCHGCTSNNCCINQNNIDVFDLEFDLLNHYIEDKHIERAKTQMERKDGLISCPFNDPKTGFCDIYENRFTICSTHACTSPKEDCNTILNKKGTMIVDRSIIFNKMNNDSKRYFVSLMESKNRNIIDQFRRKYVDEWATLRGRNINAKQYTSTWNRRIRQNE